MYNKSNSFTQQNDLDYESPTNITNSETETNYVPHVTVNLSPTNVSNNIPYRTRFGRVINRPSKLDLQCVLC